MHPGRLRKRVLAGRPKENPTWHFDTGKLKAGDYTIVAFKPSLNVSASHLGVIKRLSLPYACETMRIEDETTFELALDVPDFKAEDAWHRSA